MRTITIHLPDEMPMDGNVVVHALPPAPRVTDAAEIATMELRHDTPSEVAIAQTAHQANAHYCQLIGELSPPPWPNLPGEAQAGMIEAVRLVQSGEIKTPEEAHSRWMASRKDQGWTYGPERSYVARTHPNMVPFSQLSPAQRKKDRLFFAIASALIATE